MDSIFSSAFPATDATDWRQQIEKELKGTTHESLRWPTPDGFTLEPYYTANDLTLLPLTTIQAAQKSTPGWLNAPERPILNEKADNQALRDALQHGADALVLTLPQNPDLAQLLNGIKLSDTPVFFRFNSQSGINATDFIQILKTVAPYQLKGGLLTNTGDTAEVTRLTADSPQFRTICASSHAFHNAGATATQELSFTIASLADTYDTLTGTGLTLDELIPKTLFSLSVGTSYFSEIAKLRALRVLFQRFSRAYDFSRTTYHVPFIYAQTSTFYDSTATPYTNLIRASTEAMSAVIGGCDVLTIHPYDTVLGQSTDPAFSERIARNVSILLKDESYLDKVADPSAGSYYIETLTHELVEAAWVLFLDVEKRGGFAKAIADGFVQAEIERAYQAKVEAVRNGKVLVGVTKYRLDSVALNPERPSEDRDGIPHTGFLPDRRLAEEFE